jgi:hypothetical protein
MSRALICVLLVLSFVGFGLAQSSTVLFDGVKLFYQRPGETEFREDKGVLGLDGSQKVMLVLKENRPMLVLRYESITKMTFEEKRSKTLTIQYGSSATPSGSVRMELPGKWRQILETLRAQSGAEIEMIVKR